MNNEKLRFSYVAYDAEAKTKQESLKAKFEDIESYVTTELKPGRAQSLVLTKLEEAYMWTGKAIRDEQVERTGKLEHVAERTKE